MASTPDLSFAVPQEDDYGVQQRVIMQVRNAPFGQRATRQVDMSAERVSVERFPKAVHVKLEHPKGAGWMSLRLEEAQQLRDLLSRALEAEAQS